MFSKLKKQTIITIALLTVFYITVHIPLIKKHVYTNTDYLNRTSFEDRSLKFGDFTYYLHGALSIFDFEIDKKFNDKHYPIIGQTRHINKTDMPWYAKYVLIAYPNPSFKFGYSLTAALMTAPFPDKLFHYHIHRLVFVNIILIILSLALIFLIVKEITDNDIPAVIACLFFIFDVSNAHNSYWYQSHTMSGIFYLLLAYYLFIKSKNITTFKLGLISFLLVFSALSSSHTVSLAVLMGLFMYVDVCYKENILKILKYTLACIMGSSILPLYIVGVEKLFDFKALGLPTLLAQMNNYRSTIKVLLETFPIHLRFMWDLRIYNIFIIPILGITLLIVIYQKYASRNIKKSVNNIHFTTAITVNIINNKNYYILLFTTIIATIVTSAYTIPVSRSMTPYTVLFGILLGIFLGKRFVSGNKIVKGLVGSVILLLFLNFYLIFNVVSLPDYRPSNNILVINENEIVWKNVAIYFKDPASSMHDYYDYKMISKSIKEFIEIYDSGLSDKENAYIQFDAMDLVLAYTPTRRFIREFVPNKKDLITQMTYLKDFRFIAEIFNLYRKNMLSDADIIRRKKTIWNFALWDQEYNYMYGYANYVSKYFKDTPLESLSTHYVYYINYKALKNAFFKNQGEEAVNKYIDVPKRVSSVLFTDTEMKDENWLNYQTPEKNELILDPEHQTKCRHIVDSSPSYGGVIISKNFPLKKGAEIDVSFKIKVISGTVNMQVIEDYDGVPNYLSFGGIKEPNWTTKVLYFTATKTSSNNKINFTNNLSDTPAEFYIADVHIRTADYID